MKRSFLQGFCFLACLTWAMISIAGAQTESVPNGTADQSPAGEITDEQIAQWAEQLGDNRFTNRQKATNQLMEVGPRAIGPVTEAARGDSREATMRAIGILGRFFQSDNPQIKDRAEQALKELAEGDNTVAARLAKEAMQPRQTAGDPDFVPARPRLQVVPRPLVPGGGKIQMRVQIQNQGAGGQRITTKVTNGVKEVEVDDKEQNIKIVDDPNKGIKMEITDKKGDKPKTEKIEAKNADDLKKNHPKAYQLYEKYGKQAGGIQLQAIGGGGGQIQLVPGPAVPVLPGQPILPGPPAQLVPPPLPAAPDRMIADTKQFNEAVEKLDGLIERTEKLLEKENAVTDDELKATLETLQQAKKQLEESRDAVFKTPPAPARNLPVPAPAPPIPDVVPPQPVQPMVPAAPGASRSLIDTKQFNEGMEKLDGLIEQTETLLKKDEAVTGDELKAMLEELRAAKKQLAESALGPVFSAPPVFHVQPGKPGVIIETERFDQLVDKLDALIKDTQKLLEKDEAVTDDELKATIEKLQEAKEQLQQSPRGVTPGVTTPPPTWIPTPAPPEMVPVPAPRLVPSRDAPTVPAPIR